MSADGMGRLRWMRAIFSRSVAEAEAAVPYDAWARPDFAHYLAAAGKTDQGIELLAPQAAQHSKAIVRRPIISGKSTFNRTRGQTRDNLSLENEDKDQ